ncbi:MAG: TraG family conjugative transposon ATPase, partial [Bacteroidales bacterium]
MRNILPISTLENRSPIYKVENDCIASKYGDITYGFKVELPELFTLTSEDYQALHLTWVKAIKILPNYSAFHKQDWYIENTYTPSTKGDEPSFLSKSFERHFSERPYLDHTCYLFLTKSTKENLRKQSLFTSLSRGSLLPREVLSGEEQELFFEAVSQFTSIINDSEYLQLTRLLEKDIVGTSDKAGIFDKYFALSLSDERNLQDIQVNPESLVIGDKKLCLHTLADTEDLPLTVGTSMRYEKLSTDRSDCSLSFASPVGLVLPCNHIYNQYIFIDDSKENLRQLETSAKRMHSFSKFSRANEVNFEWIRKYLYAAEEKGLQSIRTHANVFAWSNNAGELQSIKNDVGAQIAAMNCTPRHNTIDLPTLFWAGIPGNAADFPSEDTFHSFLEPAVCLLTQETNYRSSLSPFGIKMVDRFSGRPIHLDLSDEPRKRGLIDNRNKFILGPSGSGKSFFTNHMVRQYYEQGTHVLLVDTGNSYQGLCEMVNRKTFGKDGIYFSYTEDNPIAFNPFYTDDLKFDIEKRQSLCSLIQTLWKHTNEEPTPSELVAIMLSISLYIKRIQSDETIKPCFNTYYEFVQKEFKEQMQKQKVREQDFDIENFEFVLSPYYKGG